MNKNKQYINCLLLWSAVVILFGIVHFYHYNNYARIQAHREAKAIFEQYRVTWSWASELGGIYVSSDKVEPSQFLLHIKDRDIVAPKGQTYTLVNHTYMLKAIMDEYEKQYGARGHITSLIHSQLETTPDEWERSALIGFEAEPTELAELANIGNKEYLRVIHPLQVKQGCLKCHGVQGYKTGDIRGGISISIPTDRYKDSKSIIKSLWVFTLIWFIGSIMLYALIYAKR